MNRTISSLALFFLCLPAWADCNVQAYAETQDDISDDKAPIAGPPMGGPQTITSGNQSTAFPSQARIIGFICTAKTHFKVGSNPTATTTDLWIPAEILYFTGISANWKLSILTGS